MQEIVWVCSDCTQKRTKGDTHELKSFKRYVDDIVCTVKGNPLDYLEYKNSLQKNIQLTLETTNGSGDLAFLDLNINVNEDRKMSCNWYRKSTDCGIILNFLAVLRYIIIKMRFKGLCIGFLMRPVTGNPLM